MQLPELPRDAPSCCASSRLMKRRRACVLRTDEQNGFANNFRWQAQSGDTQYAGFGLKNALKRFYSAAVAAGDSRMGGCRKWRIAPSDIETGAGVNTGAGLVGSIAAR